MAQKAVLEAVDTIYDATLDKTQWQRVVEHISAAFPFTLNALLFYDGMDQRGGEIQNFTTFDSELMRRYVDYYSSVNPWVRVHMKAPIGPVTRASDYLPTVQLRNTEFFTDWLRFADGVDEAQGCTLFREQDRLALFGVHYRSDHRRPAEIDSLNRFLKCLAPHIRRAFGLQRQFYGVNFQTEALEAALDLLETPMLIVTGAGKVTFANKAAEQKFAEDQYPLFMTFGQLSFRQAELDNEFRSALKVATGMRHEHGEIHQRTLRLPIDEKLFHLLGIFPLATNLPNRSFAAVDAARAQRFALISIVDPTARLRTPETTVQLALGITPAEARLAIATANDVTLKDFADQRGISFNTVRSQMRSILDKLGLKRQSQLTALMARSFGHFVER